MNHLEIHSLEVRPCTDTWIHRCRPTTVNGEARLRLSGQLRHKALQEELGDKPGFTALESHLYLGHTTTVHDPHGPEYVFYSYLRVGLSSLLQFEPYPSDSLWIALFANSVPSDSRLIVLRIGDFEPKELTFGPFPLGSSPLEQSIALLLKSCGQDDPKITQCWSSDLSPERILELMQSAA